MIKPTLTLAALLLFFATALNAQTQPVYWSVTQPDFGTFETNQLRNGGYVCQRVGVFPWYAAGGGWKTAIRTQAPGSAPVALLFGFFDTGSNPVALDSSYYQGADFPNRSTVSFALLPDEPAQLNIAGLPSETPDYSTTSATGVALVVVQAPDAATCAKTSAQLLYSALPAYPWSISLPVIWADQLTNVYSVAGIDDGVTQIVSVILFNDSTVAETIYLHAYDGLGNEVSGSPAHIPLDPGGTTGRVLRDLFPDLPSGIVKLKSTGSYYSIFDALQFNGMSATSLVVSQEGTIAAPVVGNSYNRPSLVKRAHLETELSQVHRHATK